MKSFCVGDLIKLKKNSELCKKYYFSNRKNDTFIIISISSYNFDEKHIRLISLESFFKAKPNFSEPSLPRYSSKDFYKIEKRLILEKKENYFLNKIMSR